ncbi:MAG: helix-hairpin-helix domain-containing protein [Thermoplasmatota archaeon]
MKPQWILFLATVSIFVGGFIGVITEDIASMLGASVLFFAASFAGAVWFSSRKKRKEEDGIEDASPVLDLEEKESGGSGISFERDPMKRDRVIHMYIEELNIPRDKAENLYDAGYTGWGDFSEAIPEDLAMVKGINPTIARRIISTVRSKRDF